MLKFGYSSRTASCLVFLGGLFAGCADAPSQIAAPDPDFSSTGEEDLTPPTLEALSFTPTINTTDAPAALRVSFTVTDELSGAVLFSVSFRSPTGAQSRGNNVFFVATPSQSGAVTVAFPRFSEAGTWTVRSVSLRDDAGNNATLVIADLRALEFPTELEVVSVQDLTAPTLTEFDFTPTINTTDAPAALRVSFTVTDELSGAILFSVSFRSPTGAQSRGNNVFFVATPSQSGAVTVAFPRFSEAGTWTVRSVSLRDAAGNNATFSTAELEALEFPTELEVVSVQDLTAPTLTEFDFTPPINTTDGPAALRVSFTVTDDLSGAILFSVSFRSPTGAQSRGNNVFFVATPSKDGAVTVAFPQFSELGTWTVRSVSLRDDAGNNATLSTADLAAQSFPTELLNANTLPGDIEVVATNPDGTPSNVSLTFEEVTAAGQTIVTTAATGPRLPDGFKFGNPPVYYDLTTTASFSGPVTVCIDYSDVRFGDEDKLRLFDREVDPTTGEEVWVDRTFSLDPTNNEICAEVSSLSLFLIVEVANEPPAADAGGPYVSLEGSPVTLDGIGSGDPDGDPLTFSWSASPPVTFNDPASDTPTATFAVGVTTVTLTVTDPFGEFDADDATVTVLAFQQATENIKTDVQALIGAGALAPDKGEDAIAKLQTAIQEFDKAPSDDQAALGAIEGAAGDLQAAVDAGQPAAIALMNQLSAIARQVAVNAVDEAIARRGDPTVIRDAQQFLADGDTQAAVKDAVNKYKYALGKAKSA